MGRPRDGDGRAEGAMVQMCVRRVGSRCFHRAFVLVKGKAKKVAGEAQASSEVGDAVRFRYYNN